MLAEGGTFAFVRYIKEGKDAFGKDASGSKAIVFVMNRSEDPVYVDVGELYGSYVCNKVSDDGIKPPLTDHLILGGNTGGNRRIGIMPYSVAFVVF